MKERTGPPDQKGKDSQGGRGGKPISLHPLTLEEALAGLLTVKPPEKETVKKPTTKAPKTKTATKVAKKGPVARTKPPRKK